MKQLGLWLSLKKRLLLLRISICISTLMDPKDKFDNYEAKDSGME